MLTCIITLGSQILQAQSANNLYVQDRIMLKINDDQIIPSTIQTQGVSSIAAVSQLSDLSRSDIIQNVDFPFYHSSSSTLRRFIELKINDPSKLDQLVEELNSKPGIEFAEKIPIFQFAITPNDPDYGTQWALTKINASSAWNYGTGSANTVVAVIDNAFDIGHEDLSPNIWRNSEEIPMNGVDDDGNGFRDDINGWDFADMDSDVNPPNSNGWDHGTHCAGIVSAVCNNNKGIAGIGYGLTVMPVKVSKDSNGAIDRLFEAITYAADNGANVISMSFVVTSYSNTFKAVIDYAVDMGCTLVAAAGNSNTQTKNYPAAFENVIAVANTDQNDLRYSNSNYGTWIDISAPGTSILSTIVGDNYGTLTGTSMSTPLVAGLAGLMLSLNPDLGYNEILFGLQSTSVNIDSPNPAYLGLLGAGRINASAAMAFAEQSLTSPPVAQFTSNFIQVVEGAPVQFTDNSLYDPDSWSWNFGDGSPISTLQNPSHIFTSTGNYMVKLTATSVYGTDVFGAIIAVEPKASCDTIANFDTYNDQIAVYTVPSPGSGFISGHNSLGDECFADYFDNYQPYSIVSGAMIYFQYGIPGEPNASINVSIWGSDDGLPGNKMATKNILIQEIINNIGALPAYFDPPVTITGPFFLGIELSYPSQNQSTVGMFTTQIGEIDINTGWFKTSTGIWKSYMEAYDVSISNAITPLVTETSPIANFTQSENLICEGSTVEYNGSGSQNAISYDWSFPGGIPATSTIANPTVAYNTTGLYNSTLTITGGCATNFAFSTITVDECTDILDSGKENNISVFFSSKSKAIEINIDIDIHSWGEDLFNIFLISSLGHQLKALEITSKNKNISLDVAELPSGVYLVGIKSAINSYHQKVVIH